MITGNFDMTNLSCRWGCFMKLRNELHLIFYGKDHPCVSFSSNISL